jgi:hypothetical protein
MSRGVRGREFEAGGEKDREGEEFGRGIREETE